MRNLLVLTALVMASVSLSGCRLCDGCFRGNRVERWQPSAPCCAPCETCAPQTPCGTCDSCSSGGGVILGSPSEGTTHPMPKPGV